MYYKGNWYTSTIFISLLFAFWFLIIPLVLGIILLKKQRKQDENNYSIYSKQNERIIDLENSVKRLDQKKKSEYKLFLQKEKSLLIKSFVNQLNLVSQIKLKEKQIEEEREKFKAHQYSLESKERIILIKIISKYLKMLRYTRERKEEILILDEAIQARKNRIYKVSQKKHIEIYELKKRIKWLKKELLFWEDEILMQNHAIYNDRFCYAKGEMYKMELAKIRAKQKDLIKNKKATIHNTKWHISGNYRKGNTQNNKNVRLTLIAFNQQCENIINKVKYNNLDVCERQMQKALKDINGLNKYIDITITKRYFNLKMDELYLSYEYMKKTQEEKEEQEEIKARMREEKKALKELAEQLAKLTKEEKHLNNALLRNELDTYEKLNLEARLLEIKEQKEEVDYRVRNERAGYVYITSNIGSFGENIYKIGMTRRLEPLDRIKELSRAAVPFEFDVHAFIFSEDAPALENTLHKTFNHKRINKVNRRKEFFKVSLHEIEKVVHQNHNSEIKFTMIAEAREYRETVTSHESYGTQMTYFKT